MKIASLKLSAKEKPPFHDVEIDDEGTITYVDSAGEPHNPNGPAVEEADGTKEWHIHGKLHRADGPAIEGSDGSKEWWANDEQHRLDGPAVIEADGTKEWWVNGKLHRLDGPAAEYVNFSHSRNYKAWYINGELIGRSPDGFTQEKFERWKKEHGYENS